jgi:ankyrin repeat protein
MGRRERVPLVALACLSWQVMLGFQTAMAAQAAVAQASGQADSLEPAKAAIRIKNYGAAARLLSEQAARDNADAQYLLGTLLLADLVPQSDDEQARSMFEAAARNGQARAAYALAAMSARGESRDLEVARQWLARAAELGDPTARDMLQRGVLPLEYRVQDSLVDEASRRLEMWRAARRGDVVTLAMLATPERVNAADEFGRTALHHAADAGAAEAVSLLLAHGAKVDAVDEYGVTPLMLACAVDPPAACARLMQAKASVATMDRSGNTALAYATRSGRTQQARELLAAGSAPVRASVSAASPGPTGHLSRASIDAYAGWPDLVVAASRREPARLRDLLAGGADPNASAPGGQTALLAAVGAGSVQAAALLLDAGADTSKADAQGNSPVGIAVRSGNVALMDTLLQHGASPNAHTARERPALVVAVAGGDPRAVRVLLAVGADANSREPTGTTPLMIAAVRDEADIAGLLLGAKAVPSTTDSSGRSALWFAACADSKTTVPILLKAGAAVDAADEDGVTPLSCAAARGNQGVVDHLLRAGASVASRTRSGDTPLMLAASGGDAGTVRRLLAAGADANAQNRLGDTALILASLVGNVDTVQVLLDAGASRKLRNRDGVAASDAARARSFGSVAALLEK